MLRCVHSVENDVHKFQQIWLLLIFLIYKWFFGLNNNWHCLISAFLRKPFSRKEMFLKCFNAILLNLANAIVLLRLGLVSVLISGVCGCVVRRVNSYENQIYLDLWCVWAMMLNRCSWHCGRDEMLWNETASHISVDFVERFDATIVKVSAATMEFHDKFCGSTIRTYSLEQWQCKAV